MSVETHWMLGLLGFLTLGATSCSTTPETMIVASVNATDRATADELREVRIVARREGSSAPFARPAPFALRSGGWVLPGHHGLRPRDASDTRRVVVEVEGDGPGYTVRQSFVTRFEPQRTVVLVFDLRRACAPVTCPDGETCAARPDGSVWCVPRDRERLPDFAGNGANDASVVVPADARPAPVDAPDVPSADVDATTVVDVAADSATDRPDVIDASGGMDGADVPDVGTDVPVGMDASLSDGPVFDASPSDVLADAAEGDALSDATATSCDAGCLAFQTCVGGACVPATQARFAAGVDFTCLLAASGTVSCRGGGASGQLGNGSSTSSAALVSVLSITDGLEIEAGGSNACVRRSSGLVYCWGNPLGWSGARGVPTALSGAVDAVSVSAGGGHTCVALSTGRVLCGGLNATGQLGDGTTTYRNSLVAVTGVTTAIAVAAGGGSDGHTCALLRGGSVVCWGLNTSGQLGDGSTMNRFAPVAVSGLSDAVELVAGQDYTCARRSTGAVVCWGRNNAGQLGDTSFVSHPTPMPVVGFTDAIDIDANSETTCAVRAGGAVLCWGNNNNGQIGDGFGSNRATPTQVSGLLDGTSVVTGNQHNCAIRRSGALVCWGGNGAGELGDGTTMQRRTPVTFVVP